MVELAPHSWRLPPQYRAESCVRQLAHNGCLACPLSEAHSKQHLHQNQTRENCMRAIHSAAKTVLHVPLGIAATSMGMATSVVIAVSSPHPSPKPEGWTAVEVTPKIVESISVDTIATAMVSLSLVEEEKPKEVYRPETPVLESQPIDTAAEAKTYLAETADPGGTMVMLGREKSVECFHPQFAMNLAAAIRDAREQGFRDAGVLSGCRPPRLGIGGFKDKKNSLHGVGLAADINGIGSPCSEKAKRFHAIAAAHGVLGVYGPCNQAEWNHVQGTAVKIAPEELRETYTAEGDIASDLQGLWSAEIAIVLDAAMPVALLQETAERPHAAKPNHSSKRGVKRYGVARHERGHRRARRHT
jgi:hypothetical protein